MGLVAEICLVVGAALLLVLYHVWFFAVHGSGLHTTKVQLKDGRADIFSKGKHARIQFSELVSKDNDTIAGIQQNRNCLIGVSFMSGTVALLAQKVLSIVLDSEKRGDPIVNGAEISPSLILGVNFVLLMTSMMAFGQSVRMHIHAGYFFKAASLGSDVLTVADTAEIVLQAQISQTIGMRLLFFFPVTALWLIGPTAMLISSVITVTVIAFLDFYFVSDKSFESLLQSVRQIT